MTGTRHSVQVTASFERNLAEIEHFLTDAETSHAFDALLDELIGTTIPNLQRFPDMGRLFLERPAHSVEAVNAIAQLSRQLVSISEAAQLREYVMEDYLLLYARTRDAVYLLSIRHQRQLSFDFQGLWV